MMKATKENVETFCRENGIKKPLMIGVTVLTSLDEKQIRNVGFEKTPKELAVHLAMESQRAGLDGVVASGKEVSRIKNATSEDFLVVTPGVRPAFATIDDQKRVVTPETAVREGSDYLVVGRAIRTAEDRVKAARAVAGEIS